MNGFKGLNVTSASVSISPDAQGDNFHGWVNIPNPSIMEIEIVRFLIFFLRFF